MYFQAEKIRGRQEEHGARDHVTRISHGRAGRQAECTAEQLYLVIRYSQNSKYISTVIARAFEIAMCIFRIPATFCRYIYCVDNHRMSVFGDPQVLLNANESDCQHRDPAIDTIFL